MVVIRLARVGRKKYPIYRIVAAEKARAVTSKYLAILGTYNPHTKDIELNKEEIQNYLDHGAQASDRVLRLFKANGIKLPKWAVIHDRNKAPKKKEGEESAPAEASAEAEVAADASDTAEAKAEQTKDTAGTAEAVDKQKQDVATEEKTADAALETAEAESKEK
jgi:small subunit ribosomal protein S16